MGGGEEKGTREEEVEEEAEEERGFGRGTGAQACGDGRVVSGLIGSGL